MLESLYRQVYRIRKTESFLADEYKRGEMRTPTHFGVGQEAVAVGVAARMSEGDVAYSHHRCHNHYLACGGSVKALAAELLGRVDGCSKGRGGSVHLTARDKGFVISSAILGETIAVATGSALGFKMQKKPNVAVTFFGEATCEEGVFHESINYASIHKLPVVFVCENNLYSTESPLEVRQAPGTDLCERARSYKVTAERVDGNDVEAVYEAAGRALEHARDGSGPVFLELMTYRWYEHVGPFYDHEQGRTYRDKAELDEWVEKCPLKVAVERLTKQGVSTDHLRAIRAQIDEEVESEVAAAYESAWPDASQLMENIY